MRSTCPPGFVGCQSSQRTRAARDPAPLHSCRDIPHRGMSTATRPHSGAVARPAHSGRPRAFAGLVTVSFSSSALAVLKDVDRFGQLAGLPGAAAEFTQDAALGSGPDTHTISPSGA